VKKRREYIDIAKCIAIFLMVMCHTYVPRSVDTVVHAFHMPVFFLMSGWVFSPEKYRYAKKFTLSRAKSLLVPYFFWGCLLFLLWNGFYMYYNRQKVVGLEEFLYAICYNNALQSPFAAVQWFLTCMFFTQLISLAVLTLARGKVWMTLLFSLFFGALGWVYPKLTDFRLPLALDVAFSSTAFFLWGYLISHWVIPKWGKILRNPGFLLLELGLGIFLTRQNGYVNMRLMAYGNPVLFYLSGTLLSLAVLHCAYYLSLLLKKWQWLFRKILFLGQNTLTILVLNQFFIQSAKLVAGYSSLYRSRSINEKYVLWFVFSLCFMAVMIPVIRFVNKVLPFSVGRKKKNRVA